MCIKLYNFSNNSFDDFSRFCTTCNEFDMGLKWPNLGIYVLFITDARILNLRKRMRFVTVLSIFPPFATCIIMPAAGIPKRNGGSIWLNRRPRLCQSGKFARPFVTARWKFSPRWIIEFIKGGNIRGFQRNLAFLKLCIRLNF